MPRTIALTGNEAAAWGARLSRVEVIAAYPITPQTQIVEKLSEWIEKGEFNAEFIRVESEHSAMAAVAGASAAGARTFTATSSHGFAYMYEMIAWVAGARLPVVMGVVNRFIGPPWNIWADWMDALSARDLGWIQIWASNNQEVLDSIIQAYKIAENKHVLLPVMVSLEGFVLSHTSEPVQIHDQELVDQFLPEYNPPHYVLNPEVSKPFAFGNILWPWDTVHLRWDMHKAMLNAKDTIKKTVKEYEELFGINHGDLIKEYETDGAEVVIVSMASIAETAENVAAELRKEGKRVGSLKVRFFRPFPSKEIVDVLKDKNKVIVVERDLSIGHDGILAMELRSVLHRYNTEIPVYSVSLGLGGDEILPEQIKKVVNKVI
ncbi:MAG: pyruvate ferredoxin oxidoreductase [Crenarchaeota archaeon]|nr:pyruvate ferredoxin oxidoreductase [Thermoproteota archaeon]MCR8453529.1 pyruvate ferredoxin oxidoreductase [Thermoproteota archaeon]MCR8454828.1 pyruvate ferredoxin oxidoreductase [Thermoproteota archaeon]MCR8462719.1 pyruvate ferredoxin oxidoreductase [Thermoproteota archaeon]MCR8470339.1 pyruvate ferredoxin oxidoreductase [Thermoproteota archaeon]